MLTKKEETQFSEWLYEIFGGDEDEVVLNFHNVEMRRAFRASQKEETK